MFAFDLGPLLATRAHPAVVHAPLGAVLFLPLALALALASPRFRNHWIGTGEFLAILALLGGLAAMASGLGWAKELGGLPPGEWLAHSLKPAPAFRALLRTHQLLALSGLAVGLAGAACLRGARKGASRLLWPAFLLSLLWLGLWGATGHWGGRMVFREAQGEAPLP